MTKIKKRVGWDAFFNLCGRKGEVDLKNKRKKVQRIARTTR